MGKLKVVLLFALVLVLAAGCSQKNDAEKPEEVNVSFDEVTTSIKEAIAKDLKEDGGVEEEVLVDGKLTYYTETDLTASTDDAGVAIWLEKMNVDQEKLANGLVIAAMMNVNADEVIVLEAKDEADVEALKASLEKELENQDQTWKQYLPEQYEKVKENIITTKGKYLLYVTYTNPEKVEEAFNSKFN